MTLPLDSGDRKILILSACLLFFLTVVAFLAPGQNSDASRDFPSSYSTGRDGAKAAYTLLGEMGYRLERWTQPPGDLPAGDTVLIIAGPLVTASAEEQMQLTQFVRRGGRLLLTGSLSDTLIGVQGVKPASIIHDEEQTFGAEGPAPLTRHAPEISMESSVRWVHLRHGEQRYYGDKDGATVIRIPLGKGEVIWWAGDTPLTNFGITHASNLALFLNSVGPPGQGRVLWDEYFHGVRQGLWHYLAQSPVPWAALQLLVLMTFILLTYARRSGPIRPILRESRLAPLEFVTTLGVLYGKSHEPAGALEIAFSHFKFLLSRRLGVPPAATTTELIERVEERSHGSIPEFAATIREIDAALKLHTVPESKALAWTRDLYAFAVRLGLEPGLGGGRGGVFSTG